jgi:hypothetical protein
MNDTRETPDAAVGDNQFDERIKASLSHRAESVRVEPDLAGLAKQDERRSAAQRFPLVAVAVVIAALAVTTAVLRPAADRDSHVISRSGNQRDRTEDSTSTTSGASPTSRSGPKRISTTTTTTATGPTSPVPPDGTTPESQSGGAPEDGTGETESDPGADPCEPVPDQVFARTSWEGDELLVVEIGSSEGRRDFGVWRDTGGSDPCHQRVTDTGGQPILFHLDTLMAEAQVEVHAFGCSPPNLEVVNGRSADGAHWFITVETYTLDGIQATLVGEPEELNLLEPEHQDTIASLRETSCGGAQGGG